MDTHLDTEGRVNDSPHAPRRGRIARACLLGLVALGLIALGAAGATVALRRMEGARTPAASMATTPPPAPAEPAGDAEVVLSPEALARAGIKTAAVTAIAAGTAVTAPGSVMANAYREVKVTPIAAGIVTKVHVELGAVVKRGAPLVTLFSAELADSQTKYMSMSAMLEADHKKLERTQKLVTLGSASRQELEEVTAVHTGHETEVAAARQRLLLLGLSSDRVEKLENASQVVSEVTVPSPADGLVISRTVNPGQVINSGQELFVVTDLSTVWVIGDLYERDFPRVRVGSPATIIIPSTPDRPLKGRIAYIDPRVDAATRTAKVRVEVPNRGELRLGMFVTVSFEAGVSERVTVVPRAAVQMIGERAVVYAPVAGEEGKFVERTVKLGVPMGEVVQVLDGVKPGEKVVTDGSFFLRAEAARTRPGG